MILIKRAHEPPEKSDGPRFLVDHLWPRGVKKERLKVERWAREVSPSAGLCKWFGHDPAKWEEFQRRYFDELDDKPEAWQPLVTAARKNDITLVFAARDTEHNNAIALKSYLLKRIKTRSKRRKPGKD